MSKYVIDSTTLSDIADAIRAKTKDAATMTPADMPAEIESIDGGDPVLLELLKYHTLEGYTGGEYSVPEVDLGDMTEIFRNQFCGDGQGTGGFYDSIRGDSVLKIGSNAFQDTITLQSVSFPACTNIGAAAFTYSGIKSYVAPATLKKFDGDSIFASCPNLETVDLSAAVNLTNLGKYTCYQCRKLKNFVFPNNTASMQLQMWFFQGCASLETFTIPANIIYVADQAFGNCTALKTVRFKGQPSSGISNAAFSGCSALTDIYVPWAEGAVSRAPWGATNATIHYNSTT